MADADYAITYAVAKAIEDHPRLAYAGVASSMAQAIGAVGLTTPDVLVMDIGFPDVAGLPDCTALRAAAPQFRIILYTAFPSIDLERWSRDEGIEVLIPKTSDSAAVFDVITAPGSRLDVGPMRDFGLTTDEMQILAALARRVGVRDIQMALNLSDPVVRAATTRIARKLRPPRQYPTLEQAVERAVDLQLVPG